MATAEMTRRPFQRDGWHYTETIATGATGDSLILPSLEAGKTIAVTLIAGAGTGYIQFTTSSDAAVKAGMAVWQTWEIGTITGTESDVLEKSTALRGVSVSGEIKIEVLI